MSRKDIENEIHLILDKTCLTESAKRRMLADLVEGTYVRPEIWL